MPPTALSSRPNNTRIARDIPIDSKNSSILSFSPSKILVNRKPGRNMIIGRNIMPNIMVILAPFL